MFRLVDLWLDSEKRYRNKSSDWERVFVFSLWVFFFIYKKKKYERIIVGYWGVSRCLSVVLHRFIFKDFYSWCGHMHLSPLPLGIWPAEDRGFIMWCHTGGWRRRRSVPRTPSYDGLLLRLFQSHVYRRVCTAYPQHLHPRWTSPLSPACVYVWQTCFLLWWDTWLVYFLSLLHCNH